MSTDASFPGVLVGHTPYAGQIFRKSNGYGGFIYTVSGRQIWDTGLDDLATTFAVISLDNHRRIREERLEASATDSSRPEEMRLGT